MLGFVSLFFICFRGFLLLLFHFLIASLFLLKEKPSSFEGEALQ